MKIVALSAALAFISFGAFAQVKKHHPVKTAAAVFVLHNNLDSTSYAYGAGLIKDLKSRGISSLNYTALNRAISDGLADKTLLLTPEQSKKVISSHYVTKFAANAVAANAFMAANKTKPGVITLPSGLQYIVLREGSGPKPKLTDTVSTNYVGTVISGKQFDASDPGKPFVTAVTDVIAGWTEGLQLMNTGAKYRFFIPYQLAYDSKGFDNVLVPYSTLIFDLELIKIGR